MFIDAEWRILTIGDGDLSFSSSLLKHHKPRQLTATVFDSYSTLSNKYGDYHYQQLMQRDCQVLTKVDITNPGSWSALPRKSYDVVIFQFPLIPGFKSQAEYKKQCGTLSTNTLNRRLLRAFLVNAFTHFLDSKGAQLCFITSKDVKPYREWNVENALTKDTSIDYLGSLPFKIADFPGYQVRNVDRDKHVKETQGITYVWGRPGNTEHSEQVSLPKYFGADYCSFCRAGPFACEQDRHEHNHSKRHTMMTNFEQQWIKHLQSGAP